MTVMLAEPELEFRSGDGYQVAEVSYPKRIVTVVAMPYERPTTIYEPGRSYQEVVSRSAFAGIEKRPAKVKANRDHDEQRIVGGAVAFHPSRTEGLVAELKVSKTPLGNETLELAADGWLDVSAGFGLLRRDNGNGPVWDDAETWEQNGTLRRLNRLYLDHVAFVPNPAYPDAAVIDVRGDAVRPQITFSRDGTPNRDTLALQDLRAESDALNRRWPH